MNHKDCMPTFDQSNSTALSVSATNYSEANIFKKAHGNNITQMLLLPTRVLTFELRT